jgi:type I restriction enzyme S subunit
MQKKAPAVRFKGFTDAWEQRKLGEVCTSFEYGLNAAATSYDGKNKYLRITDIDDSSHRFNNNDLTSPDTDISAADNYKLSDGDILFARTGASVGKTYLYRRYDGLVYFAGFLIRAKIKPDYDAEFVFQNTLSDEYGKFIRITSQRSGQPGVNAQEYADYKILVPNLNEQVKIGALLAQIDNLITLHQRKLLKLKNVKKAMLEKMFPKEGSNVPEIRFAGFTDAWEQRKLGELGKTQSGIGFSENEQGGTDGYPFFKVSDMNNFGNEHEMKIANNYVSLEQLNRMKWKPIEDVPCVIFAKVGAAIMLDRKRLVRIPFLIDNNTMAYIFDDSWDVDFGKSLFETITLSRYAQIGALPSYNCTDIENIKVSIPSLEEQTKVAKFFINLDNLITLHQRKLAKLQKIKKACLEKMFV